MKRTPLKTEHGAATAAHDASRTSSPHALHVAARLDPTAPHLARVYSYWLGGKDHFSADRRVAEEVLDHRPQVATAARANRDFLVRATEYLARDAGIRQFLDVGAGLPTPGATHEVAQAIAPDSRIVYVDNDLLVLTHARALLTGGAPQGAVACVEADLRDPAGVFARAAVTLDFTRPVAVLLLGILHFLAGQEDPAGIVTAFASGLARAASLRSATPPPTSPRRRSPQPWTPTTPSCPPR